MNIIHFYHRKKTLIAVRLQLKCTFLWCDEMPVTTQLYDEHRDTWYVISNYIFSTRRWRVLRILRFIIICVAVVVLSLLFVFCGERLFWSDSFASLAIVESQMLEICLLTLPRESITCGFLIRQQTRIVFMIFSLLLIHNVNGRLCTEFWALTFGIFRGS